MPQYNTVAIVLRRTQYAETDNILTLYSRDHGKIDAIAKGARKAISKLSGATNPLTCCNFALATGRGALQIVTQAEVIDSFPQLATDVRRMANGQYFAELLSVFTTEDHPHPELYTLLLRALRLIEKAHDLETIARWYELHMLGETGYAPDLRSCGVCDRDLTDHSQWPDGSLCALSASQGTALCPDHADQQNHIDQSTLSFDSLGYLHEIEDAPEKASAVAAIRAPSEKAGEMARNALRRYITYRLDREVKSIAFLDSLR